MTAIDYGTDLDWRDDVTATGSTISGTALLGQAVYHRLITPRGQLYDDEDYGLGLQGLLHAPMTAVERASLSGRIRNEILKDERLAGVDVTLTSATPFELMIDMRVTPSDGPAFKLVVSASTIAASITLLEPL